MLGVQASQQRSTAFCVPTWMGLRGGRMRFLVAEGFVAWGCPCASPRGRKDTPTRQTPLQRGSASGLPGGPSMWARKRRSSAAEKLAPRARNASCVNLDRLPQRPCEHLLEKLKCTLATTAQGHDAWHAAAVCMRQLMRASGCTPGPANAFRSENICTFPHLLRHAYLLNVSHALSRLTHE